jgi:hypothetical protein
VLCEVNLNLLLLFCKVSRELSSLKAHYRKQIIKLKITDKGFKQVASAAFINLMYRYVLYGKSYTDEKN